MNSNGVPDILPHTTGRIIIVHVSGRVASILMIHKTDLILVDVGHATPQLVAFEHWPQLVIVIL